MARKVNSDSQAARVFGYARVSTDKQDAERQKLNIVEYCDREGLPLTKITVETVSSRKVEREVYAVVDALRSGDTLVVTELSRLARSSIELDEICAKVIRAGAKLKSLSPDFVVDGSIQGQALKFAIGMSAQLERDFISERTKSALKVRKERGVKLGRPEGKSKLDERKDEIVQLQRYGMPKALIARNLGVSRSTYLKWLERQKESAG